MTIGRWGALASVLGGLCWLADGVLLYSSSGDDTGAASTTHLAGLVLLGVALAVSGYSLVSHAPVWLRVIPTVAFPVLVFAIWVLVRDALISMQTEADDWKGEAIALIVAGAIGLFTGLVLLRPRRSAAHADGEGDDDGRPEKPEKPEKQPPRRRGTHRNA